MTFPVIKKASYILVHTPDMLIQNGSTQTLERAKNPDSEYLLTLRENLRSYKEVVGYAPYQTYIGNMLPEEMAVAETPFFEKYDHEASALGKFGAIYAQHHFYGVLQVCDVFDLVKLESSFVEQLRTEFPSHPILKNYTEKLKDGIAIAEVEELMTKHSEGLYIDGKLVGCIVTAHDTDPNLSAHYMLENLSVKASGVLALAHLVDGLDISKIGYIIECSEEAIGDINQRGGGNIAKAIGEVVGLNNATGIDLRGFCAGPTHALVNAASLVKSEIFESVVILGGGATAKLGMNGKDHIKKGMPAVEDVLGGFAVLVSKNDGVNPILRTDIIGRHTIGDGASPQAVMEALVLKPLQSQNKVITDVDKYSAEMQIAEMTVPAGAGNVPVQNLKMIGALAVKNGQLERKELMNFVNKHGYQGFAPTQGHIPSGVPIIGHGCNHIKEGNYNNFMVIGKGSLFLGRMTNLFDGLSILIEQNPGEIAETSGLDKSEVKKILAEAMKKVALEMAKEN